MDYVPERADLATKGLDLLGKTAMTKRRLRDSDAEPNPTRHPVWMSPYFSGPRDLDSVTGGLWVGLACAWGTSGACVSGYLARIQWFTNRQVIRYDLSIV